jgi:hypothetical protein
MTIRLSIRTIVVGIILVVVAAVMAMTRTEPFPCDAYLEDVATNAGGDTNTDPREMGCFFRQHIHEKTSASVTQKREGSYGIAIPFFGRSLEAPLR